MFYSPNSSPKASSSPISIGWPGTSPSSPNSSAASSVSSTSSTLSQNNWTASTSCSNSLSCAFPSWPSRNSLSPPMKAKDSQPSSSYTNNVPSAYISDFDLFPEDLEDESLLPCLDEAPAPPRDLPMPPKLMPLFASDRPRKQRRRSSKKTKAVARPMTPIAESPLAPE